MYMKPFTKYSPNSTEPPTIVDPSSNTNQSEKIKDNLDTFFYIMKKLDLMTHALKQRSTKYPRLFG